MVDYSTMKTILGPKIWSDPDFEDLSSEAKLIVFWLLTSASRDNAGIVRISNKRIAFECSINDVNKYLDEAVQSGSFVKYEDRIWIKNWITKQIGVGGSLIKNNMLKSVLKCVEESPVKLQQLIIKEYPILKELKEKQNPSQGASKGVARDKERKGKERKGKDIIYNNDNIIKEPVSEKMPANKIEAFCAKLAKLYGSNLNAITPESKRIIWDRGITKKEEERVLLFVKKHRSGKLKDEHPIATTANRALINIGDLIERAFACNIGDLGYKKTKLKPLPVIKVDDTPLTEEQKAELKEIQLKIKKGKL